jgi:restriction endonuclease S subunit
MTPTTTPERVEFKSTGLDWLGEIPSHWKITRLKNVFDYVSRGDTPSYVDSSRVKVINQACVQNMNLVLDNVKFNEETDISDFKGRVQKNDLLMNSTGTGTLGRIGLFSRENHSEYFVDSHITILRNTKGGIIPKFYFYYFSDKQDMITELASEGATNQIELQREKLRNFFIPVPPLREQIQIVSDLDTRLSMIDEFLAQKQRFIDLLREQKQALINEAVTKGIHRQSGHTHATKHGYDRFADAPWLADVPGHWEIRRLKNVIVGNLKYGANESGDITNPDFPRYIRITDFDYDGSLRVDTFRSLSPEIAEEYSLLEGDILFARSGATVGKTFQFKNYQGKACFAGYLIKASPDSQIILSDFLYHYTNSNGFENWKNAIFNKATIENIGADKYSVLPVPLPPLPEQAEIVAHIEREGGRLDGLVRKTEREMALMREYRTALIAEAVTGKLNPNR